jgi:hypothetical protein
MKEMQGRSNRAYCRSVRLSGAMNCLCVSLLIFTGLADLEGFLVLFLSWVIAAKPAAQRRTSVSLSQTVKVS